MARTQVVYATTSQLQQNELKPPLEPSFHDYGPANETISPRSEAFPPSATDYTRTHKSRHSKKRHKHREKHSRSHDPAPSETSQNELVQLFLKQEAEKDILKKELDETRQRLEEKAQQVADYERRSKEHSDRFNEVHESRIMAEQEAARATQQLRVFEFKLENAQKEIATTQETLATLEKQKAEAEELAARARAKARKLLQKQIVLQAKEEGRRMGFEAGIRQAQEEVAIQTTARRALAQPLTESSRSSRKNKRPQLSKPPSPPPQPSSEGHQRQGDLEGSQPFDSSGTANEPSGLTDMGDSDTLRSPVFNRPSLFPSPGDNRRPPPQGAPAPIPQRGQGDTHPPSQQGHPDRTPDVQVYSLNIPDPDDITNHPTHWKAGSGEWVTAEQHRDINGSQTSHDTSQEMGRQAPAHAAGQSSEVRFAPPPAPVFPLAPMAPGGYAQSPTPPKSAGSTKKRFGSLKSKAQSWYRSFSLRRKNKPVIDPIDEEPEYHQNSVEANGHANDHPNGEANGHLNRRSVSEGDDVYKLQPHQPTSWYHENSRRSTEVKSNAGSKLNLLQPHVRSASMDVPGNRVSRASTRLSQMDLVAPPRDYVPGRDDAASNTSHQLAQKLSSIKTDSHRRPASFNAPAASTRTARGRPPDISVPNPPGFSPDNPFVQGNYHILPPNGEASIAPPLQSAAMSSRSNIDISIHPATAAIPTSHPPTAAPNSGNHLTPNYVYHRRSPSVRSSLSKREPSAINWDPVQPSNASRQSRQSNAHRVTQSLDVQPRGYQDNRSMRSGHSRTASQGVMYPDLNRSVDHSLQPRAPSRASKQAEPVIANASPRPSEGRAPSRASRNVDQAAFANAPVHAPSVHTSGSRNQPADMSGQFLGDHRPIHRVSSRSSMHSKYDPQTYVDPAFYAPDGSADPNLLHPSPNGRLQRARTPSLEYI